MSSLIRGMGGLAAATAMSTVLFVGCASVTQTATSALKTEEFMVPSADPGIQLYVRNKAPADMKSFTAEKTVLFVHGATYPSEIFFDLKLSGVSWMEYIASRGYDVYLLDIRGYGRSTRPLAMSQPASANPPFAGAEEGARDITSAVDFIFKRRAIEKLNLLGWGGGTITAALYATRNNARINKLVLYAPVWTPPSVGTPPPPPTTAYRSVSSEAARQRWYAGVPADKQGALIPAGWYEAWEKEFRESDPEGARQSPPVVRAPNGALVDILGQWFLGKRMYEASEIRVPTMLVKAEWDADAPSSMARGLFENLKNAPYKSYTEIGEGTHSVMVEKNRMQLFRAVQAFLDDPAP
jgi:pimeloyl-ACP methyl ester carboxylesterase